MQEEVASAMGPEADTPASVSPSASVGRGAQLPGVSVCAIVTSGNFNGQLNNLCRAMAEPIVATWDRAI
jgi:hypothetical protein